MNWQEFIDIWQQSETKSRPIFYRVYHDQEGCVLFYSMEDLPGLYIEIDAVTFHRSPSNAKVVGGKLVEIDRSTSASKLSPGDQGTPCDPRDVTVVVHESSDHVRWSKSNAN